jgi:hypothetical protein
MNLDHLGQRIRHRIELTRADTRLLILRAIVVRLQIGHVSPRELAVIERLGDLARKIFPDKPSDFVLSGLSDAGLLDALADIQGGAKLAAALSLLSPDPERALDDGEILTERLANLLERVQRGERLEPTRPEARQAAKPRRFN